MEVGSCDRIRWSTMGMMVERLHCTRERAMSTLSITSLAGALFFIMVVPVLAQGQAAQQGQAVPLPAGDGKALVEGLCAGCHTTDQIPRSSGYTRAGWRELVLTMIDVSTSPD